MPIQFARARVISRLPTRGDGCATRSAAYNERSRILDERRGQVFNFSHADRTTPHFHAILLPPGADQKFQSSSVLWNAVERAEKRKDSQVAKELILALPSGEEITPEDRIWLARAFADRHFVSHGLAVQIDIHQPDPKKRGEHVDLESPTAHWHAHLLITTRRIEGDRLASKKATDLNPPIRRFKGGRPFVAEGDGWGEIWRNLQNAYFRRMGYVARVDPIKAVPSRSYPPVRHRVAAQAIDARSEELKRQNETASRDPEQVIAALTRSSATFGTADLDRYLRKHLPDAKEQREVSAAVLAHDTVVPLYDRTSGATVSRYTTLAIRSQEHEVLDHAAAVAKSRHTEVRPSSPAKIAKLYPDQLRAFQHAADARGLAIIEGRAGTGKSYTLTALRDALAYSGYRVRGLGPTNVVAELLRKDGFEGGRTVHAELFALKNQRISWDRQTAVVIDEAAMLSTPILGEVMAEARRTGARVILAGDDRQFGAVASQGGLFRVLADKHGSVEINKVVRQRVDWQRQASEDMSEGRYAEAVRAYQDHGAIHWTSRKDQARARLVADWAADTLTRPTDRRFVIAYLNDDVNLLNAELRAARIDRGEMGEGVAFTTKHGVAEFSVGDRVQFIRTDRIIGVHNGNVGTITRIGGNTLRATLDTGKQVAWSAADYDSFRHGYAGTIYKSQGRTLDQAYVLHTWHMSAQASYVAMTRHTEAVSLYVSRGIAANPAILARQMARTEEHGSSLQWATGEERVIRGSGQKSPIAEAVAAYEAGRPRSDLEVWAREVTRGNLEFSDAVQSAVVARMARVPAGATPDYEAIHERAMDDVLKAIDRMEQPAQRRGMSR